MKSQNQIGWYAALLAVVLFVAIASYWLATPKALNLKPVGQISEPTPITRPDYTPPKQIEVPGGTIQGEVPKKLWPDQATTCRYFVADDGKKTILCENSQGQLIFPEQAGGS
jgi:hypothetical protein